MQFSENKFRDYLFENHKDSLSTLIIGRRKPVKWKGNGFPPLSFILQQLAEQKINKILDSLEHLVIEAKELRLVKLNSSTTRIDLFGSSKINGLTIIELKKSKQTERQAYTELLAYTNHFCSVFPGITEKVINSVLIAPMEGRAVRDAFVQELFSKNKSSIALIPKQDDGKITLSVYYPDTSYYQWFENNLLDDRSMRVVAIAFPIINEWIDDNEKTEDKDILNTISSTISHKLEVNDIHALVYASQRWKNIGQMFPYPNIIYVAYINPFTSFRTDISEEKILGESQQGRLAEIQKLYEQLDDDTKDYWINSLEYSFENFICNTIVNEFEGCFKTTSKNERIEYEISTPSWYGIKRTPLESVYTHNLDIYLSGLLNEVYTQYIQYVYEKGDDNFYYSDDLPLHSYSTSRNFLAVWEILSGLGFMPQDNDS